MLNDVVPDDEFAEIDTSEDDIDRMMATGEPVAVVTSPVLAGSSTPQAPSALTDLLVA